LGQKKQSTKTFDFGEDLDRDLGISLSTFARG